MPKLLCPVRGCPGQLRLDALGRTWACPRRHAFDRARSGYVNLLQSQDRRSPRPGDSRETVRARRRAADAGLDAPVLEEVVRELDALPGHREGRPLAVLDVGCGEGSLLAGLAAARTIDACGVDISTAAIELAAKRFPEATWVVANADRFLPWEDGAFDLLVSITSRRNGPEFRRVLGPRGRAIVAVPAEDDLRELRARLHGEDTRKDRAQSAIEDLRPDLALASRRTVRRILPLDSAAVADLLAATYRGARKSERERASRLGAMAVTFSREILIFERARG